MKAKLFVLTVALWFAGAAAAFAQAPQMGTWKLNEAKSTIPAGVQKNSTVVYEASGDNIKVTTEGTSGDGQPMHTDWTGKFDGKPYPLTGDSTADARSYKLVNDHHISLTNTQAGKVTSSGNIVVAPDGKTRTVTVSSFNPAGKKMSMKAIYDKQ